VNRETDVYRCPSMPDGIVGSLADSNGRFDYAYPVSLSGAKVIKVKPQARHWRPDGTYDTAVFTPILVEEHPGHHQNTSNPEGGHGSIDRMAVTHRKGANYVTIDTSVHWYGEKFPVEAYRWESQAPSGKWTSLSADYYVRFDLLGKDRWNWWRTQ
jgi:hypothetical protein